MMTKRIHPAQSARKLVGVASGVALVGIVTGFQFSANAQESTQEIQTSIPSTPAVALDPATGQPVAPEAAPEAVPAPAPADTGTQISAPAPQAAPPAEVPAAATAPVAPAAVAPAAPAPAAPAAPAAPVNGTTAGSGG